MINTRKKNGQISQIYSYDFSFFEKKEKEFFYFLGLMASDGNVKNDRTISLSQSGEEGFKLLKNILNKIKSNHKITKYNNSNTITITDKKIVKILEQYNIKPNKTLTYKLPKLNKNELKYFLQGYIDGDGSIGTYNNGNGVFYLTINLVGTKEFIEDLNNLIPIKGNIRKVKQCKNLNELRFYGKKAVDFGFYLYDDICFNHYKLNNFNKFIDNNDYGKKYKKYYNVKDIIIEKLKGGEKVITISNEYDIPYKTIYTWKMRN